MNFDYVNDESLPEKGEFRSLGDKNGFSPDHIAYNPRYYWAQSHKGLVKDAMLTWKGYPGGLQIAMRDEIEGKPHGESGNEKITRSQAKALLYELLYNSVPAPTLYRGDDKNPNSYEEVARGWSSSYKIAQNFSKKYNGKVYTLKNAVGIKVFPDFGEKEWIILNDNYKNYLRQKQEVFKLNSFSFKQFFENLFDDFFDKKEYSPVIKREEKTIPYVLNLYRGFNANLDSLEQDENYYYLSPKKSEQGLIWFTHPFIRGYNHLDYAESRGKWLLTYPLDVKKHVQINTKKDGNTFNTIPEYFYNLSNPYENSRFYAGIELPEGWFFSYKNEKFIVCNQKIKVKKEWIRHSH